MPRYRHSSLNHTPKIKTAKATNILGWTSVGTRSQSPLHFSPPVCDVERAPPTNSHNYSGRARNALLDCCSPPVLQCRFAQRSREHVDRWGGGLVELTSRYLPYTRPETACGSPGHLTIPAHCSFHDLLHHRALSSRTRGRTRAKLSLLCVEARATRIIIASTNFLAHRTAL